MIEQGLRRDAERARDRLRDIHTRLRAEEERRRLEAYVAAANRIWRGESA